MVTLWLIIRGLVGCFPKRLNNFTFPAAVWVSWLSIFLPTLTVIHLLACEVVSHYDFAIELIGLMYIFFGEMSTQILCHLKVRLFVFLLLSCKCYLYVPDTRLLPDKKFSNVFSHFVGKYLVSLINKNTFEST